MRSVREQVLQHFPIEARVRGPDDELKNALYALLWSIDDKDLIVDGWAYFRVIRESKESLDAVGLMTLLPSESVSESVPIEINVRGDEAALLGRYRLGGWTRLGLPYRTRSGGGGFTFMQTAIERCRRGHGVDSTMAQRMIRQCRHAATELRH